MEEVLERFRTIEFHDDFDMIVAIANGGIVPALLPLFLPYCYGR